MYGNDLRLFMGRTYGEITEEEKGKKGNYIKIKLKYNHKKKGQLEKRFQLSFLCFV